jgi:PAS domain-containing protein
MTPSEDSAERKKAEQALPDAEEFQRGLIVGIQDWVQILDLEGRLLWMNEGGMQAIEICDLGSLLNGSWIRFWEGADAKSAQAAVEAARKGGTSRFTWVLRHDDYNAGQVVGRCGQPNSECGRQPGTIAGCFTRRNGA